VVLEARRALAVRHTPDQAGGLQALEPLGEDVGGNVLGRAEEVAEAGFAMEKVTDHQQRPAVADQIERACDGAKRALSFRHLLSVERSLSFYNADAIESICEPATTSF